MFEPISGFTIGHFGLFWAEIRADFPQCVSQPAISNVVEGFGPPEPLSVELIQGASPARALYQAPSAGELVQVQSDRFSFNWKLTPGAEYPRYDKTLPRFWKLFDIFAAFLDRENLGPVKLTQCELANVNIIPVDDFGGSFADATKALALQFPRIEEHWTLNLENGQIAASYAILQDDGMPVGRLHANTQTVVNIATSKAAIRMDLTARGGGPRLDRHSAEQFFGYARNAINAAFLAYTTEEAQAFWGKK